MRALGLMICYLMCFSCVEAAGNDLLSQLDEVERKIHKVAIRKSILRGHVLFGRKWGLKSHEVLVSACGAFFG